MIDTEVQNELSPKIQSALKSVSYFSNLELSIREGRIAISKMKQEWELAKYPKSEQKKMMAIYHKLVKISRQLNAMKQDPREYL